MTLNWNREQLQTVSSAGKTLTFTYSGPPGDGRRASGNGAFGPVLVSVQDPYNRTHTFRYRDVPCERGAAYKKLTGITVAGPYGLSQVWSFDWQQDFLTRKTEPHGRVVNYGYESTQFDPNNRIRLTYKDFEGRLSLTTATRGPAAGGSSVIQRTVIVPETEVQLTYSLGDQYRYLFDGSHNLAEIRHVQTGRKVQYTYDAWHNVTSVRTAAEAAGEPLVQTTYAYGVNGRSIVGVTTRNRLGDEDETVLGKWMAPLSQVTRPHAGSGISYQPRATWSYLDLENRWLSGATVDTLENPGTFFRTLFSDHYYAQPRAVTDPLGRTSRSTVDAPTGLPLTATSPPNPSGSPADRTASTVAVTYNSEFLPAQLTDPLGRKVAFTYSSTSSPYARGNCLRVRAQALTSGGVLGPAAEAVVDSNGQVVETLDPLEVKTAFQYALSGEVIRVVEALGTAAERTTQSQYNANGDLVVVLNGNNLPATVYDYTRYSQQGQNLGIYEGVVTRVTSAAGDEYYGYDAAGNVTWRSRPYRTITGQQWNVTTYDYDALHRPTGVHYPNSPQGVTGHDVSVTYDGLGRVSSVADDTGTTSVAYDPFSRPTQVTPSGGRKALSFEYLIEGNRWRTKTFMAGVAQPWESWEDQKGRLVRQSNPFGQNTTWEYDRSGAPLAERRANGTQVQYSYDGFGRNTQIQHLTRQGTALAPLETLGHDYDAAGRIWRELSFTPAGTRTRSFTYDPLGRLTLERETYTAEPQFLAETQYFYDRNGNRTQVSRNGNREYYGYDAADKLIWTNTGSPFPPNATQPQRWTRYAYDDFGQQILRLSGGASPQRGVQQYQQDLKWDSAGRLREVQDRTVGGGTAVALSARYTADGERIEKSDPFTGTKISSFGLFDTKTKGGTSEGTLHTPGISFRKGLDVSGGAVGTTGQDRFFHTDQLGSTRHLTDGTGTGTHSTTPSRMRFDAYGLPTQLEGADGWDATEYQYAGAWGYEREPNGSRLGLDYLYQRYYDPAVGKFISADPIGIAGGLNLYAYCENDPVNAVDPSGLDPGWARQPKGSPMNVGTYRPNDGLWIRGTTRFRNTVKLQITVLYQAGPLSRRLIEDLRHSGFSVVILESSQRENASAKPTRGLFGASQCGTEVRYNPHAPAYHNTGDGFSPIVVLAHELAHAWRHAFVGVGNRAGEEVSTGMMENQFRAELEILRRIRYGFDFIPPTSMRDTSWWYTTAAGYPSLPKPKKNLLEIIEDVLVPK